MRVFTKSRNKEGYTAVDFTKRKQLFPVSLTTSVIGERTAESSYSEELIKEEQTKIETLEQRAETLEQQVEKERQQAETERQQAETERQQAETERQRA